MKHDIFEKNSIVLLIGILVVVVDRRPRRDRARCSCSSSTIEKVQGMRPYSPLELAGRDIYMREGCYNCHSQMIRSLRDEVERYGHYSLAAESMYDHPFQWGSKRTGPDLARVGGKYSDAWHVEHLQGPRAVVPGVDHAGLSVPRRDTSSTTRDIADAHADAASCVGVPYTDEMIDKAQGRSRRPDQRRIRTSRKSCCTAIPRRRSRKFDGKPGTRPTELDALIAYLQMLGTLVDFANFDASGPNLR